VGQPITNVAQRVRPTVDITKAREATIVGTGRDGVRRLYAVKVLGGRGDDPRPAVMALGIPLSVAYAAANHALYRNLLLLTLVTGLALGAAWWIGDLMILRRVRELVGATRRLAAGELEARLPASGVEGELEVLARAFNDMAAALQQRDQQQKKTEGQLLQLNQRLCALNTELEQRVEARTAELRRSNQDLQQFAYVASHDLQEPLRMVTHFVQLLQERYQARLDKEGGEFIEFAFAGAQRMQRLIQDLLSYSRVGTRGEPFQPTDCNQVLRRVLDNLQVAIQDSGAHLKCGPLPVVWGDGTQLSQLFQNLISNALKFRGAQPSVIQIDAQRVGTNDELPVGHPGAGQPVRWFRFSVRDNGPGIAPADFERIFVIFQRLHRREDYPGTGIGLSICKRIVERHCGRIWVESDLGKGATFLFVLPAPEETPAQPAPAIPNPKSQ
jgi:signal transduction histidine kinase